MAKLSKVKELCTKSENESEADMELTVGWEMVWRLKCVCENREVVVGCWALLKGGPKLRPAKFTPAVVMSVSTLGYSSSEAPASLVCKSVYSGALCEVILSVAAKLRIHRETGGPRWFFFSYYHPHSPIISSDCLSLSKSSVLC